MMTAKAIKGLVERLAKAEALVAADAVHAVAGLDGYYTVINGDGSQHYLVHLKENGEACCSCPDFQQRQSKVGEGCKHIFASEIYAAQPKPATEPKRTKTTKTAAPQEDARPLVDGAAALARLQGEDVDPWNVAA